MTPEELWRGFKKSLESGNTTDLYTSWYFSNNEKDANELLELVLQGKKRATSSAFEIYSKIDENLPKEGDFSVITNWAGKALCIIKTIKIEILPFNEVTEEFAKLEGEGDLSLKYWQHVHEDFFTQDLAQFNIAFNNESKVVCETFKLVYEKDS